MSLDFTLLEGAPRDTGMCPHCNGTGREIEHPPARYSVNITHNLVQMARAAGVYECLWRPDEHGFTTAQQLVAPLREGLARLRSDPAKFRKLNPANGWGSYEGLVRAVETTLAACAEHPDCQIHVSR